jgi:hypothetical protein
MEISHYLKMQQTLSPEIRETRSPRQISWILAIYSISGIPRIFQTVLFPVSVERSTPAVVVTTYHGKWGQFVVKNVVEVSGLVFLKRTSPANLTLLR